MKWQSFICAVAAAVCTVGSAGAFDYKVSIDEVAEHPLTAYETLYLGMPQKDFSLNFSVLPDWIMQRLSAQESRAERRGTRNGVTIVEGVRVQAADGSTQGRVLAFENYFKTNDKKTAKTTYTRLVSTLYANMDGYPVKQTDSTVTWVAGEVTVTISRTKDESGLYTVILRRYNNKELKQ